MIRIRGRYDISEAGKVNKGMWRSDQGWFAMAATSYTHTLVVIAGGQKNQDFRNEINTMISQSFQFA